MVDILPKTIQKLKITDVKWWAMWPHISRLADHKEKLVPALKILQLQSQPSIESEDLTEEFKEMLEDTGVELECL